MRSEDKRDDLTGLLNRMLRKDTEAGNHAMDVLYAQIRRIASAKLRHERPDHVLDTGALVNEAMVRLLGTRTVTVQNRQHFLALICLLMKRILIDAGRRKEPVFSSLEESMAGLDAPDRERLMAIERTLQRFRALDEDAYKVFELKVGAGLTAEEVADSVGCSVGTVTRRFRRARTWLYKEMTPLL